MDAGMKRGLAAVLLLGGVLLGWELGGRDFWEPDEPDFALISREMLASGDWVVPRRNGEPYAEKPPLIYWMTAGAARLLGSEVNGWAARVPCALSALMGSVAVFLLAGRVLGPGRGVAAALILLATPLWLLKGRWLLTDMPLAGFLAVAVAGLSRPLLDGRSPAWWGFVALALAFLAKGPLAVALAFVALAGGGVLAGRNPFRPWGRWIAGGVLALGMAAPWYLAVAQEAGPEFLKEVLWGQNARFAATGSHHRAWHYYLPALAYDLFPWSLALPAALAMAWRERRARPLLALALAWFAGGVLLLSASAVKQEKYLLPLLPAFAILVAECLPSRPHLLAWTARCGGATLALVAGGALGAAVLLPGIREPAAALGLVAGLAACAAFTARETAPLAVALASGLAALLALGMPLADLRKSARGLSETAARLAGPHPLAFYGEDLQAVYPFYAGRKVLYVPVPVDARGEADGEAGGKSLAAFFAAHPDALLILRVRDRDRLPEAVRARLATVLADQVGSKAITVVAWKARP